jgi:pimeloyl-ACP methyl ester carboxylesterase
MHSESIKLVGQSGHLIAASIEGARDGMPVILAHGGGQTRRAWKEISTLLASHGFHAIAIDMRGHGDSDWSKDGAYDIADFASDLVAIAAGLDRMPALIGASLGGLAGIVAEGQLSPGSFASLTLVDITPQMEATGVARVVGFMAKASLRPMRLRASSRNTCRIVPAARLRQGWSTICARSLMGGIIGIGIRRSSTGSCAVTRRTTR